MKRCPRCFARLVRTVGSGPDNPGWWTFDCGTVVFADGGRTIGEICEPLPVSCAACGAPRVVVAPGSVEGNDGLPVYLCGSRLGDSGAVIVSARCLAAVGREIDGGE